MSWIDVNDGVTRTEDSLHLPQPVRDSSTIKASDASQPHSFSPVDIHGPQEATTTSQNTNSVLTIDDNGVASIGMTSAPACFHVAYLNTGISSPAIDQQSSRLQNLSLQADDDSHPFLSSPVRPDSVDAILRRSIAATNPAMAVDNNSLQANIYEQSPPETPTRTRRFSTASTCTFPPMHDPNVSTGQQFFQPPNMFLPAQDPNINGQQSFQTPNVFLPVQENSVTGPNFSLPPANVPPRNFDESIQRIGPILVKLNEQYARMKAQNNRLDADYIMIGYGLKNAAHETTLIRSRLRPLVHMLDQYDRAGGLNDALLRKLGSIAKGVNEGFVMSLQGWLPNFLRTIAKSVHDPDFRWTFYLHVANMFYSSFCGVKSRLMIFDEQYTHPDGSPLFNLAQALRPTRRAVYLALAPPDNDDELGMWNHIWTGPWPMSASHGVQNAGSGGATSGMSGAAAENIGAGGTALGQPFSPSDQ
jgi:hypothetical protein